jgi:hypothetical protein
LQRGKSETLELVGWNLKKGAKQEVSATDLSSNQKFLTLGAQVCQNHFAVPILDYPEIRETEPNNASNTAQQVEMPCAIMGGIGKPGDIDMFQFKAEKAQQWTFKAESASLGFPLDSWLTIQDQQGKQLTKNDDAMGADPALEWTAPAKGNYLLSIGSVVHRGGPDYLYHLLCQRAVPGWKATVASSSFAIEPGKTNEIKVALKRMAGFKGKLKFHPQGLPEYVKSETAELSEKATEGVIKLIASETATSFSGPIQIMGFAPDDPTNGKPALNEFTVTSVNNGVPNGYNRLVIENTSQIWLTVLPKPEKKPAAKPNAKPPQ